jgi:hypothetical protein
MIKIIAAQSSSHSAMIRSLDLGGDLGMAEFPPPVPPVQAVI